MDFTGERIIPGLVDPDLLAEHVARYRFAEQFVSGKKVLDVACGVGYGAEMLAASAASVVGLDVSWEAIEYATENYSAANLCYSVADCTSLPFASGAFDVIVAFEILEHVETHGRLLEECRRVLRPGGLFAVSTPNKDVTDESGQHNPFHVREWSFGEFQSLLSTHFPNAHFFGESHVPAVSVASESPARSSFFIAVCSESKRKPPPSLLVAAEGGNVLREREKHIRILKAELERYLKMLGDLQADLAEKSRWAATLAAQTEEKDQRIRGLQEEFDEKSEWARNLSRTLDERDSALLKVQKEYEERTQWALQMSEDIRKYEQKVMDLQKEYDDRTKWALELDGEVSRLSAEVGRLERETLSIKTRLLYRVGRRLGLFD